MYLYGIEKGVSAGGALSLLQSLFKAMHIKEWGFFLSA